MAKMPYIKKKQSSPDAFQGTLASPMFLPIPFELQDQEAYDKIIAKMYSEKLQALFKHYEIDPSAPHAYQALCLRLAMDFVPGFKPVYPSTKPENKIGRPPVWSETGGIELYIHIQKQMKNGKSLLTSCKEVCNLPCYKGKKPASIKQRYYEIIERWGVQHKADIDFLIDALPENLQINLLTGYFPDGRALFNDPRITQIFADLYRKKDSDENLAISM